MSREKAPGDEGRPSGRGARSFPGLLVYAFNAPAVSPRMKYRIPNKNMISKGIAESR